MTDYHQLQLPGRDAGFRGQVASPQRAANLPWHGTSGRVLTRLDVESLRSTTLATWNWTLDRPAAVVGANGRGLPPWTSYSVFRNCKTNGKSCGARNGSVPSGISPLLSNQWCQMKDARSRAPISAVSSGSGAAAGYVANVVPAFGAFTLASTIPTTPAGRAGW